MPQDMGLGSSAAIDKPQFRVPASLGSSSNAMAVKMCVGSNVFHRTLPVAVSISRKIGIAQGRGSFAIIGKRRGVSLAGCTHQ
jgi:hypothetical protein